MRTPLLSRRLIRSAAAIVGAISLATVTQATDWVVGPSGSGADFPEIQSAIDTAAPGDTVFVLPGQYPRFELTKPLRLIGQGSDFVLIDEPSQAVCSEGWVAAQVNGIPAGTQALVAGMSFRGALPGALLASCFAIRVIDSDGIVILHDLAVGSPLAGLDIFDSNFVLISDSHLAATYPAGQLTSGLWAQGAGVRVVDSNAWIADSTLEGLGATALLEPVFGHAGLKVVNSSVFLARSDVRGGHGGIAPFGTCSGNSGYDGAPGILLAGASYVRIAGTSNNSIIAGTGGALGACSGDGASAIHVNGPGLVYRQAALDLQSSSTGGVVLPDTTLTGGGNEVLSTSVLPSLASETVNSTLTLKLDGVPGWNATMFASLGATAPIFFPGVDGSGALDPTGVLAVIPTSLDGLGRAQITIPLPNMPALQGLEIYFQWMQREPGASTRSLSNPATVLIGS